ncbi:hypothetical protein BS78_04G302300 [Paspalum vaginatum]|nr:hypothetical protein BS78_04G302300 [Paspalum vaginatum]
MGPVTIECPLLQQTAPHPSNLILSFLPPCLARPRWRGGSACLRPSARRPHGPPGSTSLPLPAFVLRPQHGRRRRVRVRADLRQRGHRGAASPRPPRAPGGLGPRGARVRGGRRGEHARASLLRAPRLLPCAPARPPPRAVARPHTPRRLPAPPPRSLLARWRVPARRVSSPAPPPSRLLARHVSPHAASPPPHLRLYVRPRRALRRRRLAPASAVRRAEAPGCGGPVDGETGAAGGRAGRPERRCPVLEQRIGGRTHMCLCIYPAIGRDAREARSRRHEL